MASGSEKPQVTEQERALAKRGANEFNRYQTKFAPLAKTLVSDIRATAGERASVAGAANADVALATRDSGTGPAGGGAGRVVMSLADRATNRAVAAGTAEGTAVQAVANNELTGLQKLARIGRNLADSADIGLTSSARRATDNSISKASAAHERLATAIDAGAGAYGYFKKPAGAK